MSRKMCNFAALKECTMPNSKTDPIIQSINDLTTENKNLKKEVESLKKQLENANKEIVHLKDSYDRVKMARAYGWNSETKKNAIARINRMVCEIDYCLALLKKIQ